MRLPVMPTYHPGKIFTMECGPNAEFKVDALSRGLMVINPAFSTVAAFYSQTGVAGPTAAQIAYITPSFLTSAATAVAAGAVNTSPSVAYRWSSLCTDIVCTTNLANVGGSVFMRRTASQVDDPATSFATFDRTYASVLADGEPHSPATVVGGVCTQSIINTHNALRFLETEASTLTTVANSVNFWRVMNYQAPSPAQDRTELDWQPIIIAIDNTGGANTLNFILQFEIRAQYLPEPSSYLSTVHKSVPFSGMERYVAASHAMGLKVAMPGKSSPLTRVTGPYSGKMGPRNQPNKQPQKQNGQKQQKQKQKQKQKPQDSNAGVFTQRLQNMAKKAFAIAANGAVSAMPALTMGAARRYRGGPTNRPMFAVAN